jgi:hypothetical protein
MEIRDTVSDAGKNGEMTIKKGLGIIQPYKRGEFIQF